MENLKKLRNARNLSQQKLAEEFNLSQQSIYKYENDLAEPDLQTLKNLAAFFHTSVDYLIDYSPEDKSVENISNLELTLEEAHLLYLFQKLPSDLQEHLISIMEHLN